MMFVWCVCACVVCVHVFDTYVCDLVCVECVCVCACVCVRARVCSSRFE